MRFIPQLDDMTPYEPGQPLELVMRRFGLTEVVKLASNEFPMPPFDEVRAAIVAAVDDLNRYPDGHCTDLRAALAAHYRRTPDEIAVGNGSCELLMLLGDVLLERGDEVVFADPSFTVYSDICRRHGAEAVAVPTRDFVHDLEAMAAAVTKRTKILFVCNPNNPTGTYVPVADIAALVECVPPDVLVVVDEAYNEFVGAADAQDAAGAAGGARERGRAAHVLQDLRALRDARRLRPLRAGGQACPRQGPSAVQREPARPGGGVRGPRAPGPGRGARRAQRGGTRLHGRPPRGDAAAPPCPARPTSCWSTRAV